MYNDHFGLVQAPFKITPDTNLFYPGGKRGEILEALIYAISAGEGIVKVAGEVGSGKTMLCRMLETRLPDSVEIVYLANPSLTPEDILMAISLEMKLDVDPEANRIQVMHSLQQELLRRHAANQRVVVFVEEAQAMPLRTLEEIRLLSNLETQSSKLLQMVLFGQPELDENLNEPSIRQLRERITHGFYLEPLTSAQIREYVKFRLRGVGYRGPDLFKESAFATMTRASEGLTRRVNILADKALLAAYAEDTYDVSRKHIEIAIKDSQFELKRRVPEIAVASGLVLFAGAVGILLLSNQGVKLASLDIPLLRDWYNEMVGMAGKLPPQPAGQTSEPVVANQAPVSSSPAIEPLSSPTDASADVGAAVAPAQALAAAESQPLAPGEPIAPMPIGTQSADADPLPGESISSEESQAALVGVSEGTDQLRQRVGTEY